MTRGHDSTDPAAEEDSLGRIGGTSSAGTSSAARPETSAGFAEDPRFRAAAWDRLYDAALDEMTVLLREQARAWAARLELLRRMDDLSSLGAKAGVAQFPQLEMAGSWNVSQITATRWQAEAARFAEALPRTLAMLTAGDLLEHQAKVLLHRTANCTVEVAQAVEAVVLPDGAQLCPADLSTRVDRAVLRIESEQADAAAAERRRAQAVAQRRTFAKPLPDGMALAGAVLTAEQMVAWQAGMDALERRERVADRDAGVERTAEQRRADLFAALPSMVLAGTAQDRAAVAAALAAAQAGSAAEGIGAHRSCQDDAQAAARHADSRPADAQAAARHADPRPADMGTGAAPTTRPPADEAPTVGGAAAAGTASAGTASAGTAPAGTAPVGAAAGVATGCTRPAPSGLQPWTLGPEQLAAHIVLNVQVPVSTVLDVSREPGTLERYGPISAEHVRLLRPRSWRRVMVESTSGRPIALDDRPTPTDPDPERARDQVLTMLRPDVVVDADEPQHDPSARLARLVDVRDVRCCGPGCASTHTHRDHLTPHPLGATSARNLGRLSPRCHRAKHAGWTLARHDDGSVTWTSPLGRVYDRPSPHSPPPRVDLRAELPPLRPLPVAGSCDGVPEWRTDSGREVAAEVAGHGDRDGVPERRTDPAHEAAREESSRGSGDDGRAPGTRPGAVLGVAPADARLHDTSAADDDLPPF